MLAWHQDQIDSQLLLKDHESIELVRSQCCTTKSNRCRMLLLPDPFQNTADQQERLVDHRDIRPTEYPVKLNKF